MQRYQRVQIALEILQQRGVGLNFAYPPIFLALARQGLPPRPLHFMSPAGLYVLGFTVFFLFFGVFLAADISPEYQIGPIRSLYALGWGGVTFLSGISGMVIAVYFFAKNRELKLPAWQDVDKYEGYSGDADITDSTLQLNQDGSYIPGPDPFDTGFNPMERLKRLFIRKKDPFANIVDYTSHHKNGRF